MTRSSGTSTILRTTRQLGQSVTHELKDLTAPSFVSSSTTWPQPPLSRTDAATYLGVSPQTLATWASNGRVRIPYVKAGRRVTYRVADLDAFIEANLHGQPVAKEEVL